MALLIILAIGALLLLGEFGRRRAIAWRVRCGMKQSRWTLTCTSAQIARLREDPGFLRIVALARLVNQLRFVQTALPRQDDDSPAGIRQRMNSFLFTAALLHEGVPLAQRLAQYYREYPSFAQGFGELLADRDVDDLLSKYIKPLRNQAVFHADERELATRLGEFEGDEFVFASGSTFASGQVYYELADITAMQALVGPTATHEEFLKGAEAVMKRTTALAIAFSRAADKLIADVMKREHFQPQR